METAKSDYKTWNNTQNLRITTQIDRRHNNKQHMGKRQEIICKTRFKKKVGSRICNVLKGIEVAQKLIVKNQTLAQNAYAQFRITIRQAEVVFQQAAEDSRMTVTNEESGNQIVTSGHVLERRKDPKTGKVYWTNHTLQKTVWKPQGYTPVQTSASPGAPQGGGSKLRWDIIIIITVTQVTKRSTRGIREQTTHTANDTRLWLAYPLRCRGY